MTVPPIYTTFRLYRGATFSGSLGVKNPDGTSVDLTGWTGACSIWREDQDQDTTPLFSLSTATGGIATLDATGVVNLSIAATDTDVPVDVDTEVWPFKLVLTNPTPDPDYVERLAQGYVIAYA